MMSAASIPPVPLSPTATITTEVSMSVISVMPETGLLPTMAMALAATVVNRNAMTATSTMPIRANIRLPSITPNQKKRNVIIMVTMEPTAIILNEMSRWVRSCALLSLLLPFISLAASDTAPFIMPHDLMIPMIPAMAIPPIPMLLPYERNISSGLICPTAVLIDGSQALSTESGNSSAMPGTISHHTESEPRQIIKAYFRPTI